MVAKMMKWRPWPPSSVVSRKLEVKLVVIGLHGLPIDHGGDHPEKDTGGVLPRLTTEVRWKGPRSALRNLRRNIRRNFTKEAPLVEDEVKYHKGEEQKRQHEEEAQLEVEEGERGHDDEIQEEIGKGIRKRFGKVVWNEEFLCVCNLTSNSNKSNLNHHPWEISFLVFNSPTHGQRNKVVVIGTVLLDLAEFAVSENNKDNEVYIPLSMEGRSAETPVLLHLSISFSELRATQFSSELMQKAAVPIPSPPRQRDAPPAEKDEISALKLGLRKVKILKDLVSKSKKIPQEDEGSDERYSGRSDDVDFVDTDSMDDDLDKGEEDGEGGKKSSDIRKSFSYGSLASANIAGGSLYSDMRTNGDYEDWIYYSNRISDVEVSHKDEVTTTSDSELLPTQTSKRSILPWKRRKLFKSPKTKGEPLLKPYGEDGGDDIDFDRRQMSSSDESTLFNQKMDEDVLPNQQSISEFGDDSFIIGSWETKEIISRDSHMKLCTQVFFASIDQRSVRAAGESACTALVAVIANWFQTNRHAMPIKSQFDSLISEGSLEWRKLCENETYRERFPDKHFDLDTVLRAKIRSISVVPSMSFIGFFHPEFAASNDDDDKNKSNNGFEILDGAMSFDNIWDEISHAASENNNVSCVGSPQLYIVSWNDHFFILMVETDAYYIIDTLGERLYEGCDQAYILKFDKNTWIQKMPSENKITNDGEVAEISGTNHVPQKNGMKSSCEDCSEEEASHNNSATASNEVERDEISVCRGKESCKEYIKNFLAAIPIRELQDDMKKGLMSSSTLIHQRLQIEFQYTELSKGVSEDMEVVIGVLQET